MAGDSRYDADLSLDQLTCHRISRAVGASGGGAMIYAGNANDYIYITGRQRPRATDFCTSKPPINATENPRRLKPINVYTHMFAGEALGPASRACRHHLDSARQASLTPIAASTRAEIADGFFLDPELNGIWANRAGSSRAAGAADRALRGTKNDVRQSRRSDFTRSVGRARAAPRREAPPTCARNEAYDEVIVALGPEPARPRTPSAHTLSTSRLDVSVTCGGATCGFNRPWPRASKPARLTLGRSARQLITSAVREFPGCRCGR